MTTLCLSILEHNEPEVINNHRHYCSRMGYEHAEVSTVGLQSAAHRVLYKYELILHYLRRLPEQALLVCASEDCVFFGMYPVENMAEGRDHLLMSIDGEGYDRQVAVQVWRNTATIRAMISGFISRAKVTAGLADERELHTELEYVPPYMQLAGNYCAIICNVRRQPSWAQYANIWVLVLSDVALYCGTHPRFRAALFEHVNDWQQKSVPLMEFPEPIDVGRGDFSVYNPGRALAIVMYYTPNIRKYGAIAEVNFLRYCRRNNYTLYVYRVTPAEAEPGVTGAWLKPWLIRKHLCCHEWMMWIDSDILFVDQQKKIEPLLKNRDIVVAHDIGPWVVNSGVLGFRQTSGNIELLNEILDAIQTVPDKSSTYASGGDQTIIADLLTCRLDWDLDAGQDLIGLNTPWFFHNDSSLMAHFFGMTTEVRAMLMLAQERSNMQSSVLRRA